MRLNRVVAWVALAIALLFGSYVRLAGIGGPDLSHDELIHFFAAQSLERGAGPHLPSGEEYRRGIDITRLSGFGARVASDTEFGARLPTAMFGVMNLLLFAAIAWAIGGPWTAVVATVLLAIYPEAVARSRGIRFYTYQLNFGLIALFATWQLVRRSGTPALPSRADRRAGWLWGAMVGIAFVLAARVQVTTLSVLAGAGLAIAIVAGLDLWRHGRRAWSASPALQLTALGALLVAAVILLDPALPRELWARSQHQPLWARASEGSVLAYYWMLSDTFPLLLATAPVAFVLVALRDLRLAVLLGCWFAVPFLLHSFVFPWKGERFIILAMPGLFLAAALASVAGFGALWSAVTARVGGAMGRLLAYASAAAIVVFALATMPALHQVRRMPDGASEPMMRRERWAAAATVIDQLPNADSLPIGSSTPLAALHYMGRADFAVRLDALGRPLGTLASNAAAFGLTGAKDASYGEFAEGVPDYYAGVPVLTTPDGIRKRFASRGEVLVVIDSTRWMYGDIEPALKNVLMREALDVCSGKCGALMAFRWQFGVGPSERLR